MAFHPERQSISQVLLAGHDGLNPADTGNSGKAAFDTLAIMPALQRRPPSTKEPLPCCGSFKVILPEFVRFAAV
jgi:hypothetical protein